LDWEGANPDHVSPIAGYASLRAEFAHHQGAAIVELLKAFQHVVAAGNSPDLHLVRQEYVHFPKRVDEIAGPLFRRIVTSVERRSQACPPGAGEQISQSRPQGVLEEIGGDMKMAETSEYRIR